MLEYYASNMYNHAEKNTLHLFLIGIELEKRKPDDEKTQIEA